LSGGHTLKEDVKLWAAFKNLKSARNTFVFEGNARLGKKGDLLDKDTARSLVSSASAVIDKVRSWLPEKHHWKQYAYNVQAETYFNVLHPNFH